MSRWIRWAFVVAGVLLLATLLARVDWQGLIRAVAGADVRWLALGVGFLVVNVVIKAVRWRLMVLRLTGASLGTGAAITAILAGVAAASFSPARTVDLAKPLLLKRWQGVSLATSTAAVLVERFFDGGALVVLFGGALLLLPIARRTEFEPVLLASGLLAIGGVLALASPGALRRLGESTLRRVPLPAQVRMRAARLTSAIADGLSLWRTRRNLWALLGLSVLAALCEAARLAAVFVAMGAGLGFAGAMLVFSAANLVGILAFIPGGIGVTELSMAAVAAAVLGLAPTSGPIAAAVLLDRVLSYYLVVGAGAAVLVGAGGFRQDLA